MRLLECNSHGTFSLTEFVGIDIPRYAILSHTWGADGDEVTFKDLAEGIGSIKTGYSKIRFCGEQAKNDEIRYFWVDTCCIDKSSSTELSEAINSMFHWYRNAAKCYVFLTDVSKHGKDENDKDSQFRKSRWFTRGWTLQELIASPSVEFFSLEGERLGDKKSLERQLHEITGVAIRALQGSPLAQFSVTERISWAAKRRTKREEDKAYSLLGIFDVHMPLIYGEGERNAFRRLQEEIHKSLKNYQHDEPPIDSMAHSTSPNRLEKPHITPWIVPFERNPRFTGRESQLAQLEGKLLARDNTTKIAVTGLGGVGKTQLVLELLYRTRQMHQNCSIIWIPATNIESLEQAYLHVAQQLGILGWEEKMADVKRLVQDHLCKESAGQWLLIFDNADDIDMWIAKTGSDQRSSIDLINYLPRSKQGCIVFTTRDKKTAVKLAHQNVVEVPEMNEKVATQLLQNCLINQDLVEKQQDTTALLAELTYLPLAIVQAAAYINENGITIAEYLFLLKEQEEVIDLLSEDFEDDGRYRNMKNPVATTWLISFEQIRRRDPLAAEYLSFMCCIDPRNVPQSLLLPTQSRKKETDAIGTLSAYSFVSRRPVDNSLDLHRLVHLATRNWLRRDESLVQWTLKAVTRLNEVFPDDSHKNRSVWRTYLPHARYVLDSLFIEDGVKEKTELLWKFAMCLYRDGRYNEAEKSFFDVMETRKRVLGGDHSSTLTSMNNLALTYIDQGQWKEAEELGVQVIETRKRVLGVEHPDTLTSMNNLALTYKNQGRWKEAEELQAKELNICSRVLGIEHPDTLTSMSNLALTYSDQGRWEEAEGLGMQIIETKKRVLGVEHPDMLKSMNNLASTYWNQGRWKEAEELGMQVLEARKRVLGAEHPDTLTSMNNLAFTWKSQERDHDALGLMKECFLLRKQKLGVDHPSTISSLGALSEWESASSAMDS